MVHRAIPIVLVLPLLAACATTPAPTDDVVRQRDAVYLEGVTTEYSVRLDELRSPKARTRDHRLPNAVVAGDQTVTVAASLFRCDDVYTLDMVVQNLGDEALTLERSRLKLFDDEGVQLSPMFDWKRGTEYGLRSVQGTHLGYKHLGTDFQSGQTKSDKEARPSSGPRKPTATSSGGNVASSSAKDLMTTPQDFSWMSELRMEEDSLLLPDAIELMPGHNVPYWAYWNAEKHPLPLTAIVVIQGKRLIFRFEEAGVKAAR